MVRKLKILFFSFVHIISRSNLYFCDLKNARVPNESLLLGVTAGVYVLREKVIEIPVHFDHIIL